MKFTDHAKIRLEEYNISEKDVANCITSPDHLYLDILTGRIVAVKIIAEHSSLPAKLIRLRRELKVEGGWSYEC